MVAVPMGRIPRFAPLAPQLRRRHLSPFLQSDAPLESDAAVLREVNARLESRVEELEELLGRTEGLCEVLDDLGGDNFVQALRSRVSWLLGLLVMQSCSSFVLAANDALLASHPTVIYFMTMLVGAGGNAGNQSAVRMIRGLATGEVCAPKKKTKRSARSLRARQKTKVDASGV